MVRSMFARLFMLFLGVIVAGCSYGHENYSASKEYSLPEGGPLVLEVNDFGRFWNRDKAKEVLDKISKATFGNNTIVLVFVHGWHHNASGDDEVLAGFGNAVKALQEKLVSPPYVEARRNLSLDGDIKVLSLYIGWRGESLPGFLDNFTFWGRKSAAETVGDGDLREFLWNLQKLYMKRNDLEHQKEAKKTFMGLVPIGHSFGGQVVFKAVTETFEKDLIDVVAETAGELNSTGKLQAQSIVSGFGDMTVLINPALEAYQYERIHRLTNKLSFIHSQAPVLFVVSAENDFPRNHLFWWGRKLTRPFRPSFPEDDQEGLWLTALGVYEPQQTHTLEPTTRDPNIDISASTPCRIGTEDLTSSIVLGKALLDPQKDSRQPFSPVVVANTSSKLVNGHSEIFGDEFGSFLTDYIAFVEGKRICIRKMYLQSLGQ